MLTLVKNEIKKHTVEYTKFIIPTLFFFALLQSLAGSSDFSYSSMLILFTVSALSAFWVTRYRFFPITLVILFSAGSVLFLITLGKNSFQHIYLIISSLLFMLSLIGLNRFFAQQENWNSKEKKKLKMLESGFTINQTIALLSIFLLSSGIYGIYIDLDLSTWTVMSAVFASIFFTTIYLTRINFLKSKALELHLDSSKNRTFAFYSFLVGFLLAEVIWAISFLPANHLTVGIIVLLLYYFFWNILKSYLRNELTKKIITLNLIFLAVAASIVLATTKWDIA